MAEEGAGCPVPLLGQPGMPTVGNVDPHILGQPLGQWIEIVGPVDLLLGSRTVTAVDLFMGR